jgi:hypothetical protein
MLLLAVAYAVCSVVPLVYLLLARRRIIASGYTLRVWGERPLLLVLSSAACGWAWALLLLSCTIARGGKTFNELCCDDLWPPKVSESKLSLPGTLTRTLYPPPRIQPTMRKRSEPTLQQNRGSGDNSSSC